MPFFTPHTPKATKPYPPIFAGLDDPFNFPTSKMRYNSRSTSPLRSASPTSTTDSGYGSIDDEAPLSPKAQVRPRDRRKLQKDGSGHWRTYRYEWQSEDNDTDAEKQSILRDGLEGRVGWRPDPRRTFTAICDDRPNREKWYSTRVHIRALEQKERCEGLTELQRSMAPVLRRSCVSLSPSLTKDKSARPEWKRKESTLLHPSPPHPHSALHVKHLNERVDEKEGRGRARKLSTLLHPSPSISPNSSSDGSVKRGTLELRSPRNRSPTPLGIPTSSERQPAPTPLRIRIGSRKLSGKSVLHSCFSDDESECDSEHNEECNSSTADDIRGGGGADEDLDGTGEVAVDPQLDDDARSISSMESAIGEKSGVILARTALVARAQRVKVWSPGLTKSVQSSET